MKNIVVRSSVIATTLALMFNTQIASAIVITDSQDATELANALLVPGSDITITSATITRGEEGGYGGYGGVESPPDLNSAFTSFNANLLNSTSGPSQSGTFTNASGTYNLPAAGGIVLSSGNIFDYEDGPNTTDGMTTDYGLVATTEQNDLLTPLTGIPDHFDPIQLDITFNVDSSAPTTITFFGAFGSEEWPEFVDSTFIDGFGLFVNGTNVAGALPTGGAPGDPLEPININHPDFMDIRGTELDGVLAPNGNPLLRFDIPVNPGVNTFTLILADAGDNALDSTMYLSSLGELGESEFTPILPDPNNPTNDDGDFVFNLPEVQAGETIWFDPDVASGYTYATDGEFASVSAPSLASVNDPDGYMLEFIDSFGVAQMFALAAGETFDFAASGFDPVMEFTITGISLDLGLDPTDPTAFVTGVSFASAGQWTIIQSPITTFVPDPSGIPEPASLLLLGLGLGGLGYSRRKVK